MNESSKLASTFYQYLIRELTKHNSRGGPATLQRQCPKRQKPPKEYLVSEITQSNLWVFRTKKNAGRNRLGCSDSPKQTKDLEIAVLPRFPRDADTKSETKKLLSGRKGYLRRIRTHKRKEAEFFFFLLFQLVFFTKTNTLSTPTSVSSSPATAESDEQDRPLPQNNLRIQNPKTKENRRETHFFPFWSSGSSQEPLRTLRPARRSNFRPSKLRMNPINK